MELILKGALLSLVVLLPTVVSTWSDWQAGAYAEDLHGREIYRSIAASRLSHPDLRTVILGDSVANQLYSNLDSTAEVVSLACNQGITLVGQYLLLTNLARANSLSGVEIVMILTPYALANDLYRWTTYHYFLKPFYTGEFRRRIGPDARERLRSIPFWWLAQVPWVKTTGWAPDSALRLIEEPPISEMEISSVSIDYLGEMLDLAEQEGFELRLIAPPLNRDEYGRFDFAALRKRASGRRTSQLLDEYVDSVTFLPSADFVDEHHYTPDTLERLGPDPFGLLTPAPATAIH